MITNLELAQARDLSWQDSALCAEVGPEPFFHEGKGDNTGPAVRICEQCPVIKSCLNYALVTNQQYGVWGGMSADLRRAILKSPAGLQLADLVVRLHRDELTVPEIAAKVGISNALVKRMLATSWAVVSDRREERESARKVAATDESWSRAERAWESIYVDR